MLMRLKEYQERVIKEIRRFLEMAKTEREKIRKVIENFPEQAENLNYVASTFRKLGKEKAYQDRCKNGLGSHYPRVVLKVPTGGGKTLLAVEAIREYQHRFAERCTGLVVWIVPKEIIYTQTINRLKDKGNPYRQWVDQISGGKTIIVEKGDRLCRQTQHWA